MTTDDLIQLYPKDPSFAVKTLLRKPVGELDRVPQNIREACLETIRRHPRLYPTHFLYPLVRAIRTADTAAVRECLRVMDIQKIRDTTQWKRVLGSIKNNQELYDIFQKRRLVTPRIDITDIIDECLRRFNRELRAVLKRPEIFIHDFEKELGCLDVVLVAAARKKFGGLTLVKPEDAETAGKHVLGSWGWSDLDKTRTVSHLTDLTDKKLAKTARTNLDATIPLFTRMTQSHYKALEPHLLNYATLNKEKDLKEIVVLLWEYVQEWVFQALYDKTGTSRKKMDAVCFVQKMDRATKHPVKRVRQLLDADDARHNQVFRQFVRTAPRDDLQELRRALRQFVFSFTPERRQAAIPPATAVFVPPQSQSQRLFRLRTCTDCAEPALYNLSGKSQDGGYCRRHKTAGMIRMDAISPPTKKQPQKKQAETVQRGIVVRVACWNILSPELEKSDPQRIQKITEKINVLASVYDVILLQELPKDPGMLETITEPYAANFGLYVQEYDEDFEGRQRKSYMGILVRKKSGWEVVRDRPTQILKTAGGRSLVLQAVQRPKSVFRSEEGEIVSRNVMGLLLRHKESGRYLIVLNVHLTRPPHHDSDKALQRDFKKQISKTVEYFKDVILRQQNGRAGRDVMILGGDMNRRVRGATKWMFDHPDMFEAHSFASKSIDGFITRGARDCGFGHDDSAREDGTSDHAIIFLEFFYPLER
jgi:hypothetical protein